MGIAVLMLLSSGSRRRGATSHLANVVEVVCSQPTKVISCRDGNLNSLRVVLLDALEKLLRIARFARRIPWTHVPTKRFPTAANESQVAISRPGRSQFIVHRLVE